MTKIPKRTGRPPNDRQRPPVHESPLYRLLVETMPDEYASDGNLDTERLSAAIGCVRFTFYRWFNGALMSVTSARKLVELSAASEQKKGALTTHMLAPFCGL